MPHTSRRLALLVGLLIFGLVVAIRSTGSLGAQTPHPDNKDLPTPDLSRAYEYVNLDLPAHFTDRSGRGAGRGGRGGRGGGSVAAADNTPEDNPITNAGATLGRVLFYDVRLSRNDTVACSSCHQQAYNFADPRANSVGLNGGATARHSMSLANARFNGNGRFFWDERASALEVQALMPIQDTVEMDMSLPELEVKLAQTTFYPALFESAFGDPAITSHRIALALAQFVRSMVSANSRFDEALVQGRQGEPVLTAQEQLGRTLFEGRRAGNLPSLPCSQCHQTAVQVTSSRGGRGGRGSTMNIGLDSVTTDPGAGGGRFKAPSLRNIAVSAPYMHDGRFATLEEVVDHYNEGIQATRGLDRRLRIGRSGQPARFQLSEDEKAALVAFLKTLTDETFLTDPKYSNPFHPPDAAAGR